MGTGGHGCGLAFHCRTTTSIVSPISIALLPLWPVPPCPAGGVQLESIQGTASGSSQTDAASATDLQLLRHYWLALQHFSKDSPFSSSYSWEQCMHDYKRELLAFVSTALPYLLSHITPAECAATAQRYGWLTHEYDVRVLEQLLVRTVQVVESGLKEGWLRESLDSSAGVAAQAATSAGSAASSSAGSATPAAAHGLGGLHAS